MSEIAALNIKELVGLREKLIIPSYQRSFSWTERETLQLITDLKDTYLKDQFYYIGSLVLDIKSDGKMEVIDGQQRLTALSILLAVLKNEYCFSSLPPFLLDYELRESSRLILEALYLKEIGNDELSKAYTVFKRELEAVEDIDRFYFFLTNKVQILEIEVPHDLDLNLYFETMNKHSVQLQRSDILKDRALSVLTDPKERKIFTIVWDAVSHFDSYLEEGMSFKLWNRMYYGEGHAPLFEVPYSTWWDMIVKTVKEDDIEEITTLFDIMEEGVEDNMQSEDVSRFSSTDIHYSITDFSNFLLIFSNVFGSDFVLDDKILLSNYDGVDYFDSREKVKEFTYNLLRLRYLFDLYIVKENEKGTYSLLKYIDLHEYRPTFKDEEINTECEKMLLKLHERHKGLEHLYYLVPILKYLNESKTIDGKSYLEFISEIEKQY